MRTSKRSIAGRPISRRDALKGLGDPRAWPKFAASVYAEFQSKPSAKAKTPLSAAVLQKAKGLLPKSGKVQLSPVYAQSVQKSSKRRAHGRKTRRKARTKR